MTQGGSLNLKNNVIWRPPPSRFISVVPSFSTISTNLFNRPGVAGAVLQTPMLLIKQDHQRVMVDPMLLIV